MKELRFLKDLPCKLSNSNKSYIELLGGDIYYDKDGNRYAFLTFKNNSKSPIFFLQLAIREYSGDGKLIKDEEFSLPYMYAPTGEFVNETPLEIDNETEAVEVFINKATFDRFNFENDITKPFTNEDYVEGVKLAPKKKWSNPNPTFEFLDRDNKERIVVVNSAEDEVEETVEEENLSNLRQGTYKKKNKILFGIPLAAVAAVLVLAVIVSISIATYRIDVINNILRSTNAGF